VLLAGKAVISDQWPVAREPHMFAPCIEEPLKVPGR
jgi:hypothetical protein